MNGGEQCDEGANNGNGGCDATCAYVAPSCSIASDVNIALL